MNLLVFKSIFSLLFLWRCYSQQVLIAPLGFTIPPDTGATQKTKAVEVETFTNCQSTGNYVSASYSVAKSKGLMSCNTLLENRNFSTKVFAITLGNATGEQPFNMKINGTVIPQINGSQVMTIYNGSIVSGDFTGALFTNTIVSNLSNFEACSKPPGLTYIIGVSEVMTIIGNGFNVSCTGADNTGFKIFSPGVLWSNIIGNQ